MKPTGTSREARANRRRVVVVAAAVVAPLAIAGAVAAFVIPNAGGEVDARAAHIARADPPAPPGTAPGTATTPPAQAAAATTAPAVPTTTLPDPVAAVNAAAAAKLLPAVPLPGEPLAAPDAAGLAAQLTAAWTAVHDPGTPADVLARQSQVQQVSLRRLAAAPELRAPTLARLAPDIRAATSVDLDAAAKLRSLVGTPRPALPAWRIVAPPPAAELLADYKAAEAEIGVPWQYLAAIHLVETRFGRIRGTSEAGARGPMQFLPATFAAYGRGGDIEAPRDAIFAAARLLRANGAPADIRRALYQYNHDNRYVDAVLDYASRLAGDQMSFRSYYGWQVYYVTAAGDVWLPVGYTNAG